MRHEGAAAGQDRSPLSPGTQCAPATPSALTTASPPTPIAPNIIPINPGAVHAPAPGVPSAAKGKPNTDPLVTAYKTLIVVALVACAILVVTLLVVYVVKRVKGSRAASGRSRWVFGKDGGTYHMFGGGGDQQLMPTALAGSGGSTMFERVVVSNGEPGPYGSHGAASASANGSKLNGSAGAGPHGPRESSEDSPSFVGTMTDIPLR